MNSPDAVIVGYYGRGNFGDDVLMIVTHALARQVLPGASIALRIGTPATYPQRMLGENIERLPFGTRTRHRLIIHGGGGTFFDFTPHGHIDRAINSALLSAGAASYVKAERILRCISGRPRLSAQVRLGFGLGIGTFTPGSPKLREALPVLSDFDGLWLRDAGSVDNLSALAVAPPVVLGSDLAFLWDHWCPPELALRPAPKKGARPRVGVILRDWPTDSGEAFARSIAAKLDALSDRFDLQLISLDPATDAATLATLSHLPQIRWQPEQDDIATFAEVLASHDVLLTARAHGAICGACLGRPSVVLEIEPKLQAVHSMLPEATRLVAPDCAADTLVARLDEALTIPADRIANDALRNRSLSERAFAAVLEGVTL